MNLTLVLCILLPFGNNLLVVRDGGMDPYSSSLSFFRAMEESWSSPPGFDAQPVLGFLVGLHHSCCEAFPGMYLQHVHESTDRALRQFTAIVARSLSLSLLYIYIYIYIYLSIHIHIKRMQPAASRIKKNGKA